MTKSEFIKRAKKTNFEHIIRSDEPVGQLLLAEVLSSDRCYLVRSGYKHQFWVTRNKKLCLVIPTSKSRFCVTI